MRKVLKLIVLLIVSLLLISDVKCDPLPQAYVKDITSNSDPSVGVIKNAEFIWNIDIQNELIQASVNYTIQAQNGGSENLILDAWNLDIDTASYQFYWNGEASTPIALVEDINDLGQGKLDLTVKNSQQKFPKQGETYYVSFNYKLNSTSKSLTWLDSNETMVGDSKQIFTQSEAIYARGLLPTQDTQQVKFTWKATIITKIKDPIVFMPAKLIDKKNNTLLNTTTYTFLQDIPVPASGIAIFAGAFEAQQISSRVQVITEKGNFRYLIDYFSDVESYIEQLEFYMQDDFPFSQINIILAPDFAPLGSALYPGLIAISPSILPFDVKNTIGKALVINGIARSWFQFGVTPSLWSCQWISHGLGTFLERYLLQKFYGNENYKELSTIGNDSLYLQIQVDGTDSTWTTLNPKILLGEDPIRGINQVVKEKGYQFFTYLETYPFGPKLTQDFIRKWYTDNNGYSRTTLEFQTQLNAFIDDNFPLSQPIVSLINFESWINSTGMPDGLKEEKLRVRFRTSVADEANDMADMFIILGGYALPQGWQKVNQYNTYQKLMFLNYFLTQTVRLNNDPNTERILQVVDQKYNFSGSKEQQILVTWITLCVYTDYEEFVEEEYQKILSTVGAAEIVLPIYQALISTDKKTIAQTQFDANKNFYEYLVVTQIQRIFDEYSQ